jgi:hypothetical protein
MAIEGGFPMPEFDAAPIVNNTEKKINIIKLV